MNSIFLKPKDLQVLERIVYISAVMKIKELKERIDERRFLGGISQPTGPKTNISLTAYADYYGIAVEDVQEALAEKRLLLIKPSDLLILEGVKNIQTASYRYQKYLCRMDKEFVNAKLSINEYAVLHDTTVERVYMLFLEHEAKELLLKFNKLL